MVACEVLHRVQDPVGVRASQLHHPPSEKNTLALCSCCLPSKPAHFTLATICRLRTVKPPELVSSTRTRVMCLLLVSLSLILAWQLVRIHLPRTRVKRPSS